MFRRVTLISPLLHIASAGSSSAQYGRTNNLRARDLCEYLEFLLHVFEVAQYSTRVNSVLTGDSVTRLQRIRAKYSIIITIIIIIIITTFITFIIIPSSSSSSSSSSSGGSSSSSSGSSSSSSSSSSSDSGSGGGVTAAAAAATTTTSTNGDRISRS